LHLLAIERGTDQILLVLARQGTARRWISARQSTDISFIPRNNDFVSREAVLLTETVEETEQGTISAVSTPDLYEDRPDNPPRRDQLEEVAPEPEPDPEPDPEPQADVAVELSVVDELLISIDCGTGGTADYQFSATSLIRGDVTKNHGASLAGVITGSSFESLQGSGIFIPASDSRNCTSVGPFDANIIQSASATDVSGIWDFRFVTLDSCDGGDDSAEGGKGVLNITQTGDQLSGFLPADEVSLKAVLPGVCEVQCAGDGTCTAACPEEGVSCTLTCSTPDCGEDLQVTGTVSPDPELPPTAEVEFDIVGDQVLAIACSDSDGSTRRLNGALEAQLSGTFRGGSTPVISGLFSNVDGQSCEDTGAFAGVICEGFKPDTGFFGVVFTEGVPQAPANLSGLWTLLVVSSNDPNEDEADGFQLNVNQVGDAFSATVLFPNDDFSLSPECAVTCSGPGECTADCPDFGVCSITCDPATPDCAQGLLINGTVR